MLTVTINCENSIPSQRKTSGTLVIPDSCSLDTTIIQIRPTKYHYTSVHQLRELDDLYDRVPNISTNLSHIQLSSPQFETVKLINQSMEEISFVKYYHPYISIPVVFSPTLLLTVAMSLAFCALHRMNARLQLLELRVFGA